MGPRLWCTKGNHPNHSEHHGLYARSVYHHHACMEYSRETWKTMTAAHSPVSSFPTHWTL